MCCNFLKRLNEPVKFKKKPDLLDILTIAAIGATAAVVVAGTLFVIKKRRAKYASTKTICDCAADDDCCCDDECCEDTADDECHDGCCE